MMKKTSQRRLVGDIFEDHRSFRIGNSGRPPGGVVERCSGREFTHRLLSLRLLRRRLRKERLRLHEREAGEQGHATEKAAIRLVRSHLDQSLNLIRFDKPSRWILSVRLGPLTDVEHPVETNRKYAAGSCLSNRALIELRSRSRLNYLLSRRAR